MQTTSNEGNESETQEQGLMVDARWAGRPDQFININPASPQGRVLHIENHFGRLPDRLRLPL